MIVVLIFLIAVFFCINMGAPSFAGSFATAAGSKAISKFKSGVLFLIFGVLGAVLLGGEVSKTLSKGIVPSQLIDLHAVLIILFAATLSLFTANMMRIPQSTSLSTLAAISGLGAHYGQVAWSKIGYMSMWWIVLTSVCFFTVFLASKYIYPPRRVNFWVYEKILNHKDRLKWLVIITSCYKAFAQGSNNVANAVGPMLAAGLVDVAWGLFMMGIVFGVGAFIFTGPLDTSSEKIVPLGLLTATVINLISGTITIVASKLGLPLPTVIVYTASIFAIGSVKDGMGLTMKNPVTTKTLFTWLINPFITFIFAFSLSTFFLK